METIRCSQQDVPSELSITVIIPTWNEMEQIEGHLNNLSEWLDCVREVVVVDSRSDDGTLEYIKTNLRHPHLKIETRPRGLYAAWNYAVRLATSRYVHFSTVGDRVPKETIFTLYENAEKFGADICLSAPDFYGPSGRLLDHEWPIHRYIKHFKLRDSELIPPERCVAWNFALLPRTLIGSSASNLYRRDVLLRSPFPENFGRMGDSVFAIRQSFLSRWVVAPNCDSSFVFHEKPNDDGRRSGRLSDRCFRAAMLALREASLAGVPAGADRKLHEILSVRRQLKVCKRQLQRLKKRPWYPFQKSYLILKLRKRCLSVRNERLQAGILS